MALIQLTESVSTGIATVAAKVDGWMDAVLISFLKVLIFLRLILWVHVPYISYVYIAQKH